MIILALIIVYISGYLCCRQKECLELQLARSTQHVLEKDDEVREMATRLQALTREEEELRRQFLAATLENARRSNDMASDARRKEVELKESVKLALNLKEENGGLEGRLHAATRRNEELGMRVADLEEAVGKAEGELMNLGSKRMGPKEPSFHHSRLLAKRDKEILELKASLRAEEQARKRQGNKGNGKQRDGELSRLKASLSAAEAKCNLKDSQIQGLSRELQKLRASSQEWEWEALQLKTTLVATEAKSGSSEDRIRELNQEVQNFKAANDRLREENLQLRDRVGEYIRLHNSGGCIGFHTGSHVTFEPPGHTMGNSTSNSPPDGPSHWSAPAPYLQSRGGKW